MRTYAVLKTTQAGTWYEVTRQHQLQLKHQPTSWRKKLWDRPNSKILLRTPRSWAIILLAYLLFYLLLTIFCAICWIIFYCTVSLQLPRTLMTEPGMTLEPICARITTLNAIEYNPSYSGEVKCYVERIESFLNKYGKMRNFGACTFANNYGYISKTPCIFLKVNRCVGFKLIPIEHVSGLPKEAPQELKAHLNSLSTSDRQRKLWISCEAANLPSKIAVQYFPKRSITASVLEIQSDDAGNSTKYSEVDFERITAVQFFNLPLNKNVKIKCNLWAKNLQADSYINIKITT